jgi:hypothetical protein
VIYRSNLKAPDLQSYFEQTTICKPRSWSLGHDILSDVKYEPDCGFMSHDEAAILYNVAARVGGTWVDLGARLGWTAAHLIKAGCKVMAVDRELRWQVFQDRFEQNLADFWDGIESVHHETCAEFLSVDREIDGFVIDADHDPPQPLLDAMGCNRLAKAKAVMVFHDFWGRPIRAAVEFLLGVGYHCRVYNTPAGMAVCWRGDFTPPDHVPDPLIDWENGRRNSAPEFDFGACS